MSGPSKLISKARKAQIKFPKIGHPPSYEGFLKAILLMPGNRQAFAGTSKDTLDTEWERQVRLNYGADDAVVRKYVDECESQHGKSVWRRQRVARQMKEEPIDTTANEFIDSLTLVRLASGRGDAHDELEAQSYADFASKVEKKNPSVVFNKDIMDRAFNRAIALLSTASKVAYKRSFERMTQRCLGRESDQYWKDR